MRQENDSVGIVEYQHPALRRLRLETCDDARAARGHEIKDHHGRRDVITLSLPDDPTHAIYYLKRTFQSPVKNGLLSLLARGRIWSESRLEFDNYVKLREAGINTAEPIGWGEEIGPISEKFSYIVTQAAPGTPLDTLLMTTPPGPGRQAMLLATAKFVRRFHDLGFAFPDLFARHIFLMPQGEGYSFSLIDVARLDRSRRISTHLRARDLAALAASVTFDVADQHEREMFLRAYGGDAMRGLDAAINKRLRHLMRRRKFAEYANSQPSGNGAVTVAVHRALAGAVLLGNVVESFLGR